MKVYIPQDFVHVLLFAVAVFLSYTTNFELQFAIWFVIAVLLFRGSYSKSFFILLISYVIILGLGFIRSFQYSYPTYHIIRDLTYFLKPILGLIIGYQAIKNKAISFLKTVVYISLAIAIVHILLIFVNFATGSIRSIEQLRAIGGYFSDFEVFAIIILIFNNPLGYPIKFRTKLLLIAVIGFSVLLYFSRTNMLQFVILLFGMLGFYKFNFKNTILYILFFVIGLVGYNYIVDLNPQRRGDGIEAYLYKIKNAPYEIYDPYVKNDNSIRFHDRFRSYETKITYLQMKNKHDGGLLLGNGFGSVVNYGTEVSTTDGYKIQFAPILHNGYTTVFLKVGLLGLLIFVFSLIYICFYGKNRDDAHAQSLKLLINSTGIFLFLSTLVFLGLYLKLDSKSLIIGGFIAYYENYINNKPNVTSSSLIPKNLQL